MWQDWRSEILISLIQICKGIKPVNFTVNQSWIFIGRTDAETEAPILWPPDAKSQLIRKDPDAGKDWGWEEKGMTEDEIVGWHLWLNGHELQQSPGDGEGQRSLACCSPWCRRVGHDWVTELIWVWLIYNVVLVSGVQQSDSIMYRRISILFKMK